MERSCAKDFGKEIGMVHEGIITLRNLGLTADGWQKMAQNKKLAERVVKLIEGEKEYWLEKIIAQERACHLDFFGKEFDLSNFTNTLKKYGEDKVRFWRKLGLEPHFLPKVSMTLDDNHPGWKVKPEEWFDKTFIGGKLFRNINGEFKKVTTIELEGVTVLIDTRLKPAYNNGKQMYEGDNLLGPIIENLRKTERIAKYEHGPQDSRFGVSAEEWENDIRQALAKKLDLDVSHLRIERAIEANIIPQLYPHMPRKDDGDTETWVWYEEYFVSRGYRLYGGNSGGGGLAHVYYSSSDFRWYFKSFRPLAVL